MAPRLRVMAGVTLCVAAGVWSAVGNGAAQSVEVATMPTATSRNFLGCPVIRDTSTVPCWLAEHEGELYYLGSQGSTSSAFYPPQLLHEVLVEATVGTGPRVCGGVPLVNVEVSVRPELNRACNTILPAEPAYVAPASPAAPIPRFVDGTREFHVLYDFDSDYLTLHATRVIHEAVRIARLVSPARIEVVGARSAVLLSDGKTLAEDASFGRKRAEKLAVILRGLGLDRTPIQVAWIDDSDRLDGLSDRMRRKTIIRLIER